MYSKNSIERGTSDKFYMFLKILTHFLGREKSSVPLIRWRKKVTIKLFFLFTSHSGEMGIFVVFCSYY